MTIEALEAALLQNRVCLPCGCVYQNAAVFPPLAGQPPLLWRCLGPVLRPCDLCVSTRDSFQRWPIRRHELGPGVQRWVGTDGQLVPMGTFVRVFNDYASVEPPRAPAGYFKECVIACDADYAIRRNGELVSWSTLITMYFVVAHLDSLNLWTLDTPPGTVVICTGSRAPWTVAG